MYSVLDLFSGIGGFSLGLERAGFETVAFCEIEPYCRRVLEKHWPDVYIHDDIKTLDYLKPGSEPDNWILFDKAADHEITRGAINVICGGYPCQPFSNAGKRSGADDDRHLWPEMYRIIESVRPRYVIAENVYGHVSMGLDAVLSDLEAIGYKWDTFIIPACAVDARHRRARVWIIAYAERDAIRKQSGRRNGESRKGSPVIGNDGKARAVAHAQGRRPSEPVRAETQQSAQKVTNRGTRPTSGNRWPTEPGVGRVANGVPRRVDRLRALGNAVVPQVVEQIGRIIIEFDQQRGSK